MSVSSALSPYLLAVVLVAAVGGGGPAWQPQSHHPPGQLVSHPAAPHAADRHAQNVLSLIVFVSVASRVKVRLVATRRSAKRRACATKRATWQLWRVGGSRSVGVDHAQLQQSFGLDGVVLRATTTGPHSRREFGPLAVVDCRGDIPRIDRPGVVLAATGRTLSADDHRVLRSSRSSRQGK